MKAKSKSVSSERGFTLVEMMAAVGVLLMVGMVIGVSVNGFYRTYQSVKRAGDELNVYLKIDRLADNIFRNTIPFKWKNDQDEEKIVFRGSVDELYLASQSRAYSGEYGAFVFARIFLEDGKLICEYSPVPYLPWTEGENVNLKREVVAEKIKNLKFTYAAFDENNEVEWIDEYNEDDYIDVPIGIMMTLDFEDGRSEVWLRRTAGQSGWTQLGL